MAVNLLRLIVEDDLLLPPKLEAAKPCDHWFLSVVSGVSGVPHLARAVGRFHRRPVLPVDLARAGSVCIRAGQDQGERHAAVDPSEAVDVGGQQGVLDEAPVLGLVLRHKAVICIIEASCPMDCLAAPQVRGAFRSDDCIGNLQSGYAVAAASVLGTTLLVVGVLLDNLVAEEARGLGPGVRDQRLLV